MRPQPTFVTLASGIKLHYRLQGNPDAPWMVMLNGLLSDTTMWAGVLPGLAPHARILSFDFRGQGRSDTPPGGPCPVPQLAEDAWELFRALGIEKPWLVGLSNGSSVSLELLASHPGAFRGAVLTSSMPCIDFTTRLRMLHWVQCLDVGGPLMQFDAVAPYLWGDRFLEQRHHVLRAYHRVVTQGRGHLKESEGPRPGNAPQDPFEGARNQVKGILDWDIRPRLGQVKDPVLLLCGAEDLLTPPWKCLETAKGIPHSRFEIIPGIGHAFPVEAPKAFAERVLRFIDDGTSITNGACSNCI